MQFDKLRSEIDFDSEHYYNLLFESAGAPGASEMARETWSNLASLLADLNKMRGELSRIRRSVEELRMPAIEAIGLDRVVETLRTLETRLRPLGEVLNRQDDEGRFRRMLKDMIVVVDTLDRVFELAEQQPGSVSAGVLQGLKSVRELLMQTLGRYGLTAMEVGREFDPHQQMAMGTEPNGELADGSVSRVLQRGYLLDSQVLRTAQVVVVRNK
jgi:hypothetical protein